MNLMVKTITYSDCITYSVSKYTKPQKLINIEKRTKEMTTKRGTKDSKGTYDRKTYTYTCYSI